MLSPAKQKKPAFNTSIPRVSDFQYSISTELNGTHFFSSQILYTAEDSNCLYRAMTGSMNCNLKEGFVFWPDGKCYAFGFLGPEKRVIKEEELSGKSGYYYLKNDSIFIETFGISGLGFGYYYYQGCIDNINSFKLDEENWYYREPKRKRKHRLKASELERIGFDLPYYQDSSIDVKIVPSW